MHKEKILSSVLFVSWVDNNFCVAQRVQLKICNSLDNRFKLHVFHHQLPDYQFPNKTNVKCNSKFVVNYLHERYHPSLNKLLLLCCIKMRCFKSPEFLICNYFRIFTSCFYSICSLGHKCVGKNNFICYLNEINLAKSKFLCNRLRPSLLDFIFHITDTMCYVINRMSE